MKHYLKIWSLLMLFMHLYSMALVSVLPGEHWGVTFRKECLREKAIVKVAATEKKQATYYSIFFLQEPEEDRNKNHETKIKVCSLELLSTEATASAVSLYKARSITEPHFNQPAYLSVAASRDPDPPRFI